MSIRAACTLALIPLVGCASASKGPSPEELAAAARAEAAAEVASLLTGTFTSTAQSVANPDYLDIHVGAAVIWPERQDGPWIYIEQAAANSDPYRQRIYHIVAESPDVVVSRIHEIPGDGKLIIGAHEDPSVLAGLTPEDLVHKVGCDVRLVRTKASRWSGGTTGEGCLTDWGEASHATSEVTVDAAQLRSWDRGWREDGELAWGPEQGPYIFDRVD